jgi:hypothetical protein
MWERFGKELKILKHPLSRTESTGHMFLARTHNPKVISSNLTPRNQLSNYAARVSGSPPEALFVAESQFVIQFVAAKNHL